MSQEEQPKSKNSKQQLAIATNDTDNTNNVDTLSTDIGKIGLSKTSGDILTNIGESGGGGKAVKTSNMKKDTSYEQKVEHTSGDISFENAVSGSIGGEAFATDISYNTTIVDTLSTYISKVSLSNNNIGGDLLSSAGSVGSDGGREVNCIKKDTSYYEQKVDTFDSVLFRDPPQKEECSICMLPMPYLSGLCGVRKVYMPCCGKFICYGCSMAEDNEIENGNLKPFCSFCRVPMPFSFDKSNRNHANKEQLKRLKKRMELNDAEAFYVLGCAYRDGDVGLSQDMNKAFELLNQSAELGSISAHYSLALSYLIGEGDSCHYLGLSEDFEKSMHHTLLAAIGGHEVARLILGNTEKQLNNKVDRAVKHWTISARSGVALLVVICFFQSNICLHLPFIGPIAITIMHNHRRIQV